MTFDEFKHQLPDIDPAETEGIITPFMVFYALHDAMVKPMPASCSLATARLPLNVAPASVVPGGSAGANCRYR